MAYKANRPGALIAGCWAVMQHMGTEYAFHSPAILILLSDFVLFRGYLSSCRDIVLATRTIADAITDDIPELYVLGNPPASVVAFGSRHPNVDALEVGDAMGKRGWHLNGLSDPKSVHIACTVRLFLPCEVARELINFYESFAIISYTLSTHFIPLFLLS